MDQRALPDLLPCPCCGGRAVMIWPGYYDDDNDAYVQCDGCQLRTRQYLTPAQAMSVWNQREAISDYIRAQAIEIDNLRARIDDVASMLAQSDKRNYILRLALLFIANQENLTFAECSIAEAVVGKAKEALVLTDAIASEPRRPE